MPVESPCIRSCCLDKEEVCIGCGRTVEEITRWGDANDNEKLKILAVAGKRKQAKESIKTFEA